MKNISQADTKETLLHAYALLNDVTPLKADCGALCFGACCKPDADGQGGVHLFPGEKERLMNAEWASLRDCPDLGTCTMLTCLSPCLRDERPMGCRMFPLTPIYKKNGEWDVRLDIRAWAMCPLMSGGLRGLNPDFVQNARQAIQIMAQNDALLVFLRRWTKLERSFHIKL